MFCLILCVTAVSYTHLDVYKRQLMSSDQLHVQYTWTQTQNIKNTYVGILNCVYEYKKKISVPQKHLLCTSKLQVVSWLIKLKVKQFLYLAFLYLALSIWLLKDVYKRQTLFLHKMSFMYVFLRSEQVILYFVFLRNEQK